MEDNSKIDLTEIRWEGVDWTHDRDQWQTLVNMLMNLWVQQKVENFLII
jgi:hypothetical protein